MAFPPDAFLIGAEKCGTTTLTDLLDQHPGLALSHPRDMDFFTRNFPKGLDWYRTLFAGRESLTTLDVSLSYSSAPLSATKKADDADGDPRRGVPGRIHSANPDAKFIYIIRDPVSRTYSSYWHAVRYGYKDIGFRKALDVSPNFLDTSDYAGQLKNYLEYFSSDAFLFVVFEDMVRSPQGQAKRVFEFLGIDTGFEPVVEHAKNQSFRYNAVGRLLRGLLPSGDAMNKLVNIGQALTPRFLEPTVRKFVTSGIPKISEVDRDFLKQYFRPKNRELEQLTGLDLRHW